MRCVKQQLIFSFFPLSRHDIFTSVLCHVMYVHHVPSDIKEGKGKEQKVGKRERERKKREKEYDVMEGWK